MRLILYGLGQGLDLVEERVKEEHQILGYVDSYSKLAIFREKPFYNLDDIREISFDYIIITIQDGKAAWKVYNLLINEYGIAPDCIIPYYIYANREIYNMKMNTYDLSKIQGLIFGNSHAECGFLEEELRIPFINMAVSAQDIYYSYKIFQKCISKYGSKLKNLRYIIIDLYDYCCFNLDASIARYAIDYICWGGYLDEHNFNKNHNYQKTFREELFDRAYIPEKTSSMCHLFSNVNIRRNDLCAASRWRHIEKRNCLTAGPIIGGVVTKRSETTIKENIGLLNSFLKDIKSFNGDIEVIFTLIPRYIEMERATEIVMKEWKKEFENIVYNLCDKYNANFWNYKNRRELSENHMFYYDVEHMNTVGGRAISGILNEDLKKLIEIKKGIRNE